MVRFPDIKNVLVDDSWIVLSDYPYAKHNKTDRFGHRQIGFLTEHTIFFVLEGEKRLHFEDHTVPVAAGSLLLLKKGIYVISEYMADGEQFEALMTFIPDSFLQQFCSEMAFSSMNRECNPCHCVVPSTTLLNNFRMQYMHYFGRSFEFKEQLIRNKLRELLLLLLSTPQKDQVATFLTFCANEKRADLDFLLRQHLLKPLTVSDFARLSGRSLAAFKRDFRRKYDTSPKAWINKQRLSHASDLLMRTTKNISEIAHECGFENVSHFIRLFKREYQVTPGVLRAKKAIN